MHDPTQDEMEVSAKVGLVAFCFSRIAAFSHPFAWELWVCSSALGWVVTAGAKVERAWNLIDAAFQSDLKGLRPCRDSSSGETGPTTSGRSATT